MAGPRRQADVEWIGWAASVYARLARTDEEFVAVLEFAREAEHGIEMAGNRGQLAMTRSGIAVARLGLRQVADAAALLESILADVRRLRVFMCEESRMLTHLAEARLALGDAAGAGKAATAAVDTARRQGATVFECFARLTRARVGREAGNGADGIDGDLRAALALARQVGATAYEAQIEAELAAGRSSVPWSD